MKITVYANLVGKDLIRKDHRKYSPVSRLLERKRSQGNKLNSRAELSIAFYCLSTRSPLIDGVYEIAVSFTPSMLRLIH